MTGGKAVGYGKLKIRCVRDLRTTHEIRDAHIVHSKPERHSSFLSHATMSSKMKDFSCKSYLEFGDGFVIIFLNLYDHLKIY